MNACSDVKCNNNAKCNVINPNIIFCVVQDMIQTRNKIVFNRLSYWICVMFRAFPNECIMNIDGSKFIYYWIYSIFETETLLIFQTRQVIGFSERHFAMLPNGDSSLEIGILRHLNSQCKLS